MTEQENGSRWYDQDPVLGRALEQLREAPDKYQAQVALNIIKIMVEHQMEEDAHVSVEDLDVLIKGGPPSRGDTMACRRWYDVHETLGSAMKLLEDCPEDLQSRLIPSIAHMIEQTLSGASSKYPE